jgi:sulfate/thiosulfate transport system permease protein
VTVTALPRRAASGAALPSVAPGVAATYLSIIVLLPLAALLWVSGKAGWSAFEHAATAPDAVAALELTVVAAVLVAVVNAAAGTLVAWVLVRDTFRGKAIVNSMIDLPFALPTIVAGLTLLTLYGPNSPIGLNITYTRYAVVLALLFETLPFVIRSVQPVLLELDRDMEDAAASLGARAPAVFRRIILPNLVPAILSGCALAFARAIGEFGSVVMLSGNVPFSTEVASVHIFSQVQSDYQEGAAAMSIVLLALALAVLMTLTAVQRWGSRHDR